jgi:hypothetical protein
MQLHTYLNYGGNCEDAFKCFWGRLGAFGRTHSWRKCR